MRPPADTSRPSFGQPAALTLFHQAAERVPAYADFLRRHGVNPALVTTAADFASVPVVDKANYLTKYPLDQLVWDGNLASQRVISASSGSTGQPFFWPRGAQQDVEGAWFHRGIFADIFGAANQPTLLVICFSMGTWIAGSYTMASALNLIDEGLPLNVVTPGIEKTEAVKAIKGLAPYYGQVILAGYPPLIKDILQEGQADGINWRQHNLRFLWAGESFGEEWRDHVLKLVGDRDPYHHSVSVFGSADAGLLGHETPVSVLARRLYNRSPALAARQFDSSVLPAIIQYHADRRFFENVGNELVFTANAGIPLVRYNIHDTGGVLAYDDMVGPLGQRFAAGVERHHIDAKRWQLPFVYLKGRSDFTVTIYGVTFIPKTLKPPC
jgi:phenylacetate-CoA ligase